MKRDLKRWLRTFAPAEVTICVFCTNAATTMLYSLIPLQQADVLPEFFEFAFDSVSYDCYTESHRFGEYIVRQGWVVPDGAFH